MCGYLEGGKGEEGHVQEERARWGWGWGYHPISHLFLIYISSILYLIYISSILPRPHETRIQLLLRCHRTVSIGIVHLSLTLAWRCGVYT